MLSEDDIRWLGALAQEERHDLLIFSDEIYEYIVYGKHRHVSVASVRNLRQRTLTIGGYSKTFSITGWRIGYLAGPEQIINRAAGVVSDLLYVCAPHPLQRGVLKGLDAPRTAPKKCADSTSATVMRFAMPLNAAASRQSGPRAAIM